ncbi:NUDIX hydrolase [Clostridia bacterium]|nr:NUDIX hydrolase [Clostridia bacterium]
MGDYEVLNSKHTYHGQILDVYIDTLNMPNGKPADREIVTRAVTGASAVVAVSDDLTVTLVKQYRHPAKRIMLELPAGIAEDGEDLSVCAARELLEETGLTVTSIKLLTVIYPSVGYCAEQIHIFLARVGDEIIPQKLDSDEFVEIEKYPLAEAVKLVEDGKIDDGKTIIGLLMAARLLL